MELHQARGIHVRELVYSLFENGQQISDRGLKAGLEAGWVRAVVAVAPAPAELSDGAFSNGLAG